MAHWQSKVLQAAAENTPAKATGSWQDYYDFEAPLLTMLLVLASQALTDCATKTSLVSILKIPILRAGADGAASAVFRDTVNLTLAFIYLIY